MLINWRTKAFITIDVLENGTCKIDTRILDADITQEEAHKLAAVALIQAKTSGEILLGKIDGETHGGAYYVKSLKGRMSTQGPEFEGVDGTPRHLGDARIYSMAEILKINNPGDYVFAQLPPAFTGLGQEWVVWSMDMDSIHFMGWLDKDAVRGTLYGARIYTETPKVGDGLMNIELPQFSRQQKPNSQSISRKDLTQ